MREGKFNTSILLITFNRPDKTLKVFEQIRRCKPVKLFISTDGPREGVPEDRERCEQVRKIISLVDWDCEVKTLLRERNLGCKLAVSSAIDWFFENEEKGIILEDDTLPDPTFFRFCAELLEDYRDDERIMMISGDNFQFGRGRRRYSYYFSRYSHVWGWASWRRAWNFYDINMKLWPEARKDKLFFNILDNKRQISYWSNIFEKTYTGKINSWDYQWIFACWLQNGLIILPAVNLVSNIGFESSGTHTRNKDILATPERERIGFPLMHPPYKFRDAAADEFTEKSQYSSVSTYRKIISKFCLK